MSTAFNISNSSSVFVSFNSLRALIKPWWNPPIPQKSSTTLSSGISKDLNGENVGKNHRCFAVEQKIRIGQCVFDFSFGNLLCIHWFVLRTRELRKRSFYWFRLHFIVHHAIWIQLKCMFRFEVQCEFTWTVDAADVVDVVFIERSEPVVMSVAAEIPECIEGIDDIVVPKSFCLEIRVCFTWYVSRRFWRDFGGLWQSRNGWCSWYGRGGIWRLDRRLLRLLF